MGKKRIGIYYNYSDSWIGGKYYLDSIIGVLNQNPDNELIFLKRPLVIRIIGRVFGRKSRIYRSLMDKASKKVNLDFVFPFLRDSFEGKKNICWIPDFQENYYPEFFSHDEICSRLVNQARIAYSDVTLVLSSYSAKKDFERLFPKHSCKVEVLSFVSSLIKGMNYSTSDVLQKYDIHEPYFICSNQLWKHKNHLDLVRAIETIKKDRKHILCLFTGKEEDFRNPDYPVNLKKLVVETGLSEEIRFLGFISREDQVELMRNSIAIIQPSLFEGWNTTIEDGKFLKKAVIASKIPVQIEQLGDKGLYFEINDYEKLAELLTDTAIPKMVDYHYDQQVTDNAKTIERIFSLD